MTNISTIEEFCRNAFALLNIDMQDGSEGTFILNIPMSCIDVFNGRQKLKVAFDSAYISDDIDLIASGTEILDNLINAVKKRGGTVFLTPMQIVKPSSISNINIRNGSERLVSTENIFKLALLVYYKISLISDENRDELFRCIIDIETCNPVMLDIDKLINAPDDQMSSINPLPYDQLAATFEAANNMVRKHAETRLKTFQHEIENRLQVEIDRLDSYYEELADYRVSSNSGSFRRLQASRDKAIQKYNHIESNYNTIRVFIESIKIGDNLPLQIQEYKEALHNKRRAIKFSFFEMEKYYEKVEIADEKIKFFDKIEPTLLKIGELSTVDERLAEFDRLRDKRLDLERKKWESKEIQQYGAENIEKIEAEIGAEKSQRINELREKYRLNADITPISAAVIKYPLMQFNYEAVSGDKSVLFSVVQNLITGEFDLCECDSCNAKLSDAYVCSCGHLVCPSCVRVCVECKKEICASCVSNACQICGGMLCDSCIHQCDICGKTVCVSHIHKCEICGANVCGDESHANCEKICSVCGKSFCNKHTNNCPVCNKIVCENDMKACSQCGIIACSNDVFECPVCGVFICNLHTKQCELCNQMVCSDCIDEEGLCAACSGLFPAAASVSAIEQIIAELTGRERKQNDKWVIGENNQRFVFVNVSGNVEVYVIDKSPIRLYYSHAYGFIDSIREKKRINKIISNK